MSFLKVMLKKSSGVDMLSISIAGFIEWDGVTKS